MVIEKDHGYKNQPFKNTMYRKKTMVFFYSYGLLDALGMLLNGAVAAWCKAGAWGAGVDGDMQRGALVTA